MKQVFKLYRLQQVDQQLDQVVARLEQIDQILKDSRAVREAEEQSQQANERLEATQKALRRAEEDTRAQRRKIEQNEAALYGGGVTNPKELQDLQRESGALKRYLEVLEERQLEAMLLVDEARERAESAAQSLEEIEAHREAQSAELLEEKEALLADLERLQTERSTAVASIPEEELEIYETLRTSRQGLAVALVSDGTCSACGSTLSSALLGAARSPSELARCGFCGRILYAS